VPDLVVRVVPRSSRDAIGPFADGVLHVRVTRPPTGDEANRAVVRLVAGALGVPPTDIDLVTGRRARTKRLRVAGLPPDELTARLRRLDLD
jgi:uncharacterized protein YggU (UPF0235/DUF167 family)